MSDKLYQRKEPVISSVHTKVKGLAEVTENVTESGERKSLRSVFDTADYTFPLQVSTRQLTPGLIPGGCWLGTRDLAQRVECLTNMYETLGSVSSAT